MTRLTSRRYWNTVHTGGGAERLVRTALYSAIGGLFGERGVRLVSDYHDYLLWERIFPACLGSEPLGDGHRHIIEIGSAPGTYLVGLKARFGWTPHGVEYAETGVAENRRVFAESGIDPDNVIHADFLSDAFHRQHDGRFDIVLSRGFIEHFHSPEPVVSRHLDMLKPGGILVLIIPNLRGINYGLQWLLDRRSLAGHNVAIMERRRFARLFARERVEPLFCGYYGTFSFGLFSRGRNLVLRLLRAGGNLVQLFLNLALRAFCARGGLESRHTSPYLLYIGRKR